MSIDPFVPLGVRHPDLSNLTLRLPEPPAKSAYDRINKMIREFEANLDGDLEVGMCVVGGPGNQSVHVTGIGYWGSDIIRFFGSFSDGRAIEIIQNVAQINIMLMAVPKMGDEPIRLGEFEEEPQA